MHLSLSLTHTHTLKCSVHRGKEANQLREKEKKKDSKCVYEWQSPDRLKSNRRNYSQLTQDREGNNIIIWAFAKRCSARTIHFLVLNASSGLSFLWTNLTLSERVCIKEIIKINLTPKVSSELVKYENLHQVRAENRQKKGGHFGCTASVVV